MKTTLTDKEGSKDLDVLSTLCRVVFCFLMALIWDTFFKGRRAATPESEYIEIERRIIYLCMVLEAKTLLYIFRNRFELDLALFHYEIRNFHTN
jgi:hypothetical protein